MQKNSLTWFNYIYIHITILQWEYNHTPLHGPRQRTNPIQNQASFPGGY